MEEQEEYLTDMEREEKKIPEKTVKIWQNMASDYISREQLKEKGKRLAHYKSRLFFRTYIDIYEKAIIGLVDQSGSRKLVKLQYGYFYLKRAVAENGMLFLIMCDETIYRIRYLKNPEMVAHAINRQKAESER